MINDLFADQEAADQEGDWSADEERNTLRALEIQEASVKALHRLAKRKRQGKTLWDAYIIVTDYAGEDDWCTGEVLKLFVAIGFYIHVDGDDPEDVFESVTCNPDRCLEGCATYRDPDGIREAIAQAGRFMVMCPDETEMMCYGMAAWQWEQTKESWVAIIRHLDGQETPRTKAVRKRKPKVQPTETQGGLFA